MSDNAERLVRPRLFYIFVRLTGLDERPEFYIVPSQDVAERVTADHRNWSQAPGKHGQRRNPTKTRVFRLAWAQEYRDRWDRLAEATR